MTEEGPCGTLHESESCAAKYLFFSFRQLDRQLAGWWRLKPLSSGNKIQSCRLPYS